jgi:hypothetical protein
VLSAQTLASNSPELEDLQERRAQVQQLEHGAEGVRTSYRELLGTEDDDVIHGYLACLAAKQVKGHWWCPCGSGKRLRDCHVTQVLSPADALKSLRYLRG